MCVEAYTMDTRWTLDGHSMDTTMDTTMDTGKTCAFCIMINKELLYMNKFCFSARIVRIVWFLPVSIVVSIVVSIECPSSVHRVSIERVHQVRRVSGSCEKPSDLPCKGQLNLWKSKHFIRWTLADSIKILAFQ